MRVKRCRYCYEENHNKRTCPQRSEATKNHEKVYYRKKACSYCNIIGHTRPKCAKLTEDMARDVLENRKYRNDLAAYMIKSGIGIGALIKRDRTESAGDNVYMITEINLDFMTHREPSNYGIQAKDVENLEGYARGFSFPIDAPMVSHYTWARCEVVSPASEEDVKSLITTEWLTGTTGLDKFYKKPRS